MAKKRERQKSILQWMGVCMVVVATGGAWVLYAHNSEQELRSLPSNERRALFERTFETLRSTCPQAAGPTLTDYCREQAEFVARFPECDRVCREYVDRIAPRSTR